MPGKGQRTPTTAQQWEAVDVAYLAGLPILNIAENLGMSHRRVSHLVRLLGHTPEQRRWTDKNRVPVSRQQEKHSAYVKRREADFKKQVFDHYGRTCACCGEDEVLFLTIDHMNNDGAKDRKTMARASQYEALVKRDFPPGFQILCLNCNRGKWLNKGSCPHVTAKNLTGNLSERIGG